MLSTGQVHAMQLIDCSNIHRVEYHRVLLNEAKRLGAKIHLDCEVINVDTTAPSVTLSSGQIYSGDAVIGADGNAVVSLHTRNADEIQGFDHASAIMSWVSMSILSQLVTWHTVLPYPENE